MKTIKRIKVISLIFIILASLYILINTYEFFMLGKGEFFELFYKFDIDISNYIAQENTKLIINFFLLGGFLISSILTYRLLNIGRIALSLTLITIIIFNFLSPVIFNIEFPDIAPRNVPNAEENIKEILRIIKFSFVLIKAIVSGFVIYYLNKKDVVNIFLNKK